MSIPTRAFKNIRVGLDCANGASSNLAKSVFDALGAKTYVIHSEPDGLNINTNCGSTHIESLQELVKSKGLDIGFAYDGDADRCLAVDEFGRVIDGVGIAIDTRKLSPEERAVLGAWVSLLAIALVRAGLSSEAKQATMLREADKLRTALFNSVSHELRTPLAAIMASVYTLNDKAVAYGEKQRQQLLETIADASKRMERIIGNLLDTARLESGMLQLKLDWCDLEDVVSGALRRSKEHTQSYKIKVEIADDLPLIYADAALLEHVVLNLLDNAVKYSVEGSEIEIQTCLDDSEVIVMVKDRGLGVTAKDLSHLFDKFYRARQTE